MELVEGLDIYERFDQLAKRHRAELGVHYGIRPMFGPYSICALHRPGSTHGQGGDTSETKGNGKKALTELCWLADQLHIVLTLGTSRKRLIPYFEQFGFAVTEKLGGDYGVIMQRPLS